MANIPYTFANQSGNIPLAELDANFANVKASADTAIYVTGSNQSNITSLGTLTSLSVSGNTSLVNLNATNANITNFYSGNITGTVRTAAQPQITSLGILTGLQVDGNTVLNGTLTMSSNAVIGNLTVSNQFLSSGNATVGGNLLVLGNATIQGTTTTYNSTAVSVNNLTITVGNNVSTSAAINGAGLNAGNPTVAYIRYSDTYQGWNTANNFVIGGNLFVSNANVPGILLSSTPANATSNTQVATTAFVHNLVGTLGTMASQNANSVNITAGSINSLSVGLLGTNGYGAKTISTSVPSGGSDGDIWYQI